MRIMKIILDSLNLDSVKTPSKRNHISFISRGSQHHRSLSGENPQITLLVALAPRVVVPRVCSALITCLTVTSVNFGYLPRYLHGLWWWSGIQESYTLAGYTNQMPARGCLLLVWLSWSGWMQALLTHSRLWAPNMIVQWNGLLFIYNRLTLVDKVCSNEYCEMFFC